MDVAEAIGGLDRNRRPEWLMGLVVLVLTTLLANRAFVAANAQHVGKSTHTVVIDPGHGGVDPGKIGVNDAKEKDINLQIAMYLREELEAAGLTVVLTREDDEGLYGAYAQNKKLEDMQKRCAIIRETDPDITVSVHQNSYHDGGVSGCQVFYYADSEQGKRLAGHIQTQMIEALSPEEKREAKANDSYYMLRHTTSPTVIVECGFLSNWTEAQRLTTEEYQKKVAQAIAAGVIAYFEAQR